MDTYISGVIGLTRMYLIRFWRSKTAMFFTFLFPAIFLFVFGSLSKTSSVSFNIALINHSSSAFSQQFVDKLKKQDTFHIKETDSNLEDAKEKMNRGEIDTIIELPKTFGDISADSHKPSGKLNVYYDEGKPQAGQTMGSVMQSVLDGINQGLGQPKAPFTVAQVSTGKKGLTQFDYTFAGLIGFTILSMGVFGLANSMPNEKARGTYRRLRASSLSKSQLIIATGLYNVIIGTCSVALMFVIGMLMFGFTMHGDWLATIVVILLSLVMMSGFGLAIGSWAQNDKQAAPLSNLVSFPMMFLSGVFFPRFLMPEWLQGVTTYVPLTPIVDSLRQIMTEGKTLVDVAPLIGLIVVWMIIVYTLAIRVFRWE